MPFINHFDLLAPLYDRFIDAPKSGKIFNLIDLPANGSILDAGGGTGRVVQSIKGSLKRVVVVDVSMGMLRVASKNKHILPICAHAEALPFENGIFDRIIMVDALHHVCDQRETAGELWRMLRKGGRIVIEEPNVHTFSVKIVALFEKFALMRSHFLTPEQIESLFSKFSANSRIEYDGTSSWVILDKK